MIFDQKLDSIMCMTLILEHNIMYTSSFQFVIKIFIYYRVPVEGGQLEVGWECTIEMWRQESSICSWMSRCGERYFGEVSISVKIIIYC